LVPRPGDHQVRNGTQAHREIADRPIASRLTRM
jgi:hypothetical protein